MPFHFRWTFHADAFVVQFQKKVIPLKGNPFLFGFEREREKEWVNKEQLNCDAAFIESGQHEDSGEGKQKNGNNNGHSGHLSIHIRQVNFVNEQNNRQNVSDFEMLGLRRNMIFGFCFTHTHGHHFDLLYFDFSNDLRWAELLLILFSEFPEFDTVEE